MNRRMGNLSFKNNTKPSLSQFGHTGSDHGEQRKNLISLKSEHSNRLHNERLTRPTLYF